ncbi:tetratricopeptide repeat protein [Methylocapsa polymorpha]|uniref:protein O-GlcNAc transferase n=1 Tax=Methylocapsa polymorpha TaxID=3080828 RepID=A0ABZ0HWB3_9HYPH|nr:tetratricopeptide repeat protein [Methylocapsa sp. RX1]
MVGLKSERLSEAPVASGATAGLPIPDRLVIALEYFRAGRYDEAQEIYAEILATCPDHFVCLHHLGLIAHQRGDHDVAARLVDRAVTVQPDYVEAFSNLSAIHRALGKSEDSAAAARRAIALDPNFAQAHSNLGASLEDQGQLDAALAAYRRAASLNPSFVEAHSNAANVLRRLSRPEEAIAVCEDIIALRPDAAEPYFSLGNILRDLCRPGPAIEAYKRAIALRPNFAQVYANLGNVLQGQEAFEEAVNAYAEAIALRPTLAEAHVNMGAALDSLGRLDEAIQSFRRALELNPKLLAVRAWLHHKRRLICDWAGIDAEEAELRALMESEPEPVHPFVVLGMRTSAAEQLSISRKYAESVAVGVKAFAHPKGESARGRKLRIGYLSSDFCRHATALLTVELFERHDSSRFEITAYSHGADDHSEMSARLRAAFDHFVDIGAMSDDEAAARIHADKIDILVELKGYTKGARTGIAARRPAPIQVSFIGFPGTMGADFIDYVIADSFVLPMDQQGAFSEKIVHLPHCYQPNDTRRLIADLTPTRAECGLPEKGFVFCSFNNSYKITPDFFDIWMRLLIETPGSVLWLLESNDLVKSNLAKGALKRGVDPDRLVFAPRLPSPEHLARHRLADLFLDTLPYNAHTTASDALWAGLPVLTCAGDTFAGRVAGSLLHAVGLPELVTSSLSAYESLALRLAREPALLQSLRHKLLGERLNAPLFDTPAYTRSYEAALAEMWANFANGREPRPFAVASSIAADPPVTTAPQIQRLAYLACPLCESDNIPAILGADCSKHPIYHSSLPPVMTWRECQRCGHVFTDGYFDAEAAAVVFSKTQPNQTVGFDMERQRPVSARIVERVARHAPPSGDWLDVGFGSGSLLFAAEEWGYAPVGLDLRKDNVHALNLLGYEAHCLSIDELGDDERFSVISMADVLEHMPFPKAGLVAARWLLRPNGVLFLSMPNMDNMVWRLLHANNVNPYWGEIEHYHNFTRKRLYALLEEHGFKPVEYHISERYRVCMEVIAVKQG